MKTKLLFLSLIFSSLLFAGILILAPVKPAGGSFTPTSISGIQLWLSGKDPNNNVSNIPTNGATISTWTDKSGIGNNFAGSGTKPVYATSVVNGNNCVSFTRASNTYLSSSASFFTSGTAFDLFFVIYPTSNTGTNFFFNDGQTHAPVLGFTSTKFLFIGQTTWASAQPSQTFNTSTAYGIEFQYNGSGATTQANFALNVDGSSVALSGSDAGAGGSTTALGSDIVDPSLAFGGYVCEVIFYNNIISSGNRTSLQNYFNTNWGVQ